jgi:hypothetical protein
MNERYSNAIVYRMEWVELIVVVHGENFIPRILVGVDVHHPAEDHWMKTAARGVASIFAGDGALEAKLGHVCGAPLVPRRHAEIRVQVPHRHAQGDASIELIFCRALGHGVHGADELVAIGSFLVEQGSRSRGIE